MRINQFDVADVPRDSKQALLLDVMDLDSGEVLRLPVLVARGAQLGPTIAVLGGVHGDEYEGPHAVREVFGSLDTSVLSGTFIGAPSANPPAFAAGTRTSPLDGLNLARVFPGSEAGSPTERIAYYLGERVIARSDFLIDLHSSGTSSTIPPLIGYLADGTDIGRRSRDAAFIFGAPVVWGHPTMAPGRSTADAASRGIPWLYTESPGGGWLSTDTAAMYARGVTNVMKHISMLPGRAEPQEPEHHLLGDGTLQEGITAREAGFLVREVEPLDRVSEGDVLGRVLGPVGESLEEVRADSSGVVLLVRMTPSVSVGDLLFFITGEAGE